MPKFRYLAYSTVGNQERGEIDAPSARDALNELNARGLVPYSAVPSDDGSNVPRQFLQIRKPGKLSLSDYAEMMRELSVLLTAGMPLDQCLRLLSAHSELSRVARLTAKLHEAVVSGASLSEAIRQHTIDAPTSLASLIRAGEARGNLAETLTELSGFFNTRVELREQIRSALLYPVVLAVTALAAIVVIFAFLVPALAPLFGNAGAEVPLAFQIATSANVVLTNHWPTLLVALAGLPLLSRVVLRIDTVQDFFARFTLRAPLFGKVATANHVATIARTLGTLLANGVPLVSALTITSEAVPNRYLSRAMKKAGEGVKEGKKLSSLLDAVELIPKRAVRFVAVGEESSNLHGMLLHLAETSQQEARRRIERAVALLTPALTIVLGLLVGSLVLTVMQAILGVNELFMR